MTMGTVLYAATTIPFNTLPVPGAGGLIAFRPTVAIPMMLGIAFGPLTGFVSGFLGNVISDGMSFNGFFWNWEIASGLLGAIPGLVIAVIARTDWTKLRSLPTSVGLVVIASIVGAGFGALADYVFLVGAGSGGVVLAEFSSAAGTDAVNGAIFTPILLYAYARATVGRARRV